MGAWAHQVGERISISERPHGLIVRGPAWWLPWLSNSAWSQSWAAPQQTLPLSPRCWKSHETLPDRWLGGGLAAGRAASIKRPAGRRLSEPGFSVCTACVR